MFLYIILISLYSNNLDKIITKLDMLYRANTNYYKLSIVNNTPGWSRQILIDVWTSDNDKAFIRIIEPAKDKGVATLRLKNEIWNYFPKIKKTIKISPSMLTGSWMNTELSFDDILKISTFNNDYNCSFIDGDDKNYYYIEANLKETSISLWQKIQILVNKTNLLPIRKDYYDINNKKLRTLVFKDVKNFDNQELPSVVEIINYNNLNSKTIITYKDAKFNTKIDNNIFTHRNF